MVQKLPLNQKKALIMRFWCNYSISDVSKKMRLNWEEADQLIENGLKALRKEFFEQFQFSKNFKNQSSNQNF